MKNYLVVGGSSGIGQQVVHSLAQSTNTHVWATYNQGEQLNRHPDVTYFQWHHCSEQFSELPEELNGVVFCPGTINLKPFHRLTLEDFQADFLLQVGGLIKTLQAAYPSMKNAVQPSVVLFSTVAVQRGMPFHSLVASSKGAVEGITRSLAAEWAPKIRVNAIAPGLVNTPLSEKLLSSDAKKEASSKRHPLQRYGEVVDIQKMVSFLLSEDSSWITGQIFHVDGGISSIQTT